MKGFWEIFDIKSTQSKEYSIGHKKTTTNYWKSVVNAKKPNVQMFFIYFVLEFSIYILQFDFFWHLPLFAIICWSFFVTNTVDLKLSTL